jgi:hypothetical protein
MWVTTDCRSKNWVPVLKRLGSTGLNNLKIGVKIFSMIQEAGVLQPLEMQTQLQMSMKW